METRPNRGMFWLSLAGRLAGFVAFSLGVLLPLLWLAGWFQPKVPAEMAAAGSESPGPGGQVVAARLLRRPVWESAVGSVRAVHETAIGSKLLARVESLDVRAGQPVKQGDVLARLDDTDLKARLRQIEAALVAVEALHAQAEAEERRYAELSRSNAVSKQQYEKVRTDLLAAAAELQRAKEAVNEVQAMLEWATIRAPMDGVVVDKRVEAGDTVTPGQVLVTLYDPTRMQLVASVRESLTQRLAVGQEIPVSLEGLNKECSGTVSEIVPESQFGSRTFQVKVTGPCPPGIYSGMFGRLKIPLDEEQVLVIPRQAVRQVGQLEFVEVSVDGQQRRRAVRTGRALGADVEVLSGLRAGEQVVVAEAPPAGSEPAHG